MAELKEMYRTVMDDHFPETMTIAFGDQILTYRKRAWKIPDDKTGELIEKGLRYGENPGQEAALYELVDGNLTLGDCRFIEPGLALVSSIAEAEMLQAGKHPGKTNLTDLDNGLNILRYLDTRPAAVILKHNNPCGAAHGGSLADAYDRANMADRIAAFGGCVVFNQPVDKVPPNCWQPTIWKWWQRRIMKQARWRSSSSGLISGSSRLLAWTGSPTTDRAVSWNSNPLWMEV